MSGKQRLALAALVLISVLAIVSVARLASRSNQTPSPPTPKSALESAAQTASSANKTVLGRRTKTQDCVVQGSLPDAACTPGDILSTDVAAICTPGYASKVRDVSASKSASVYVEYGVRSHSAGQFEVDHLISLELGGSNSIANLWPEAAASSPGFHEKDRVENYLHDQVCSGALSLAVAQVEIAHDWTAVYRAISS